MSDSPDVPAPAQHWCIITCEYPPMAGGVSDHTFLLAEALVAAGDTVDVWTPRGIAAPPSSPNVTVYTLPSLFRPDALNVLRRVIREASPYTRVLIQYVPTSFGWRMMNLPFAILLFSLRRHPLDVYFHEVGFPISKDQRLRRSFAGAVHVVMNWFAVRAASRVFVAIPEWERRLEQLGADPHAHHRYVRWVPVPSNVPDHADADRVETIRSAIAPRDDTRIVGHFGTFGRYHVATLRGAFIRILDDDARRVALLIGRNSGSFRDLLVHERPDLATRIIATGGLEPAEVSAHLSAADVLLQPYDDGVSARRGSLMAGLALGRPIVSNSGAVTGDVWLSRNPVYLTDSDSDKALAAGVTLLLGDAGLRNAFAHRARAIYEELFALRHGVALLRDAVRYARPVATRGERVVHPRVLMLHTTLPTPGRKPGGVEVAVHRLANALVDLGVPITVASLSPRPADARYAYRPLFRRFPWLRDSRFGRLVILPILLNFVSFRGTDVVHYHGDDWFVLRRPRATIRTLHGSALREAERATRWQRRWVQRALYPFEKLSRRLTTVSAAVGKDTADLHGIRRVIGNGVDSTMFKVGRKSNLPMLLYVGTWAGRKRGEWMYELFTKSIATRHPTVELRFVADVAPPPHPRVRFEKFPDDATLACAYREAWVFVLPSTYEGFGIPYLEAMASGTAVVTTPNTGARELLADGEFGELVGDDEFADTVLELLRNDERREALALAGLARSRDFLWGNIARSYLDAYDEALVLHHNVSGGD